MDLWSVQLWVIHRSSGKAGALTSLLIHVSQCLGSCVEGKKPLETFIKQIDKVRESLAADKDHKTNTEIRVWFYQNECKTCFRRSREGVSPEIWLYNLKSVA